MATSSPPMARLLTLRFLNRRGAVRVPGRRGHPLDGGSGRGWRGTKGRPAKGAGGWKADAAASAWATMISDPTGSRSRLIVVALTCSPFTSLATAPAGINYKLYTVDLAIAPARLTRRGLAGVGEAVEQPQLPRPLAPELVLRGGAVVDRGRAHPRVGVVGPLVPRGEAPAGEADPADRDHHPRQADEPALEQRLRGAAPVRAGGAPPQAGGEARQGRGGAPPDPRQARGDAGPARGRGGPPQAIGDPRPAGSDEGPPHPPP